MSDYTADTATVKIAGQRTDAKYHRFLPRLLNLTKNLSEHRSWCIIESQTSDRMKRNGQMLETPTDQNTVVRTSRGLSIAGTRITLYTIMDHLELDWPAHLIRDWFNLTDEQMQDVLDYIEAHREEVEAEYQQVLEEAEEIEHYWREYNREHFAKLAARPVEPGQEEIRAKLAARKAKWQAP